MTHSVADMKNRRKEEALLNAFLRKAPAQRNEPSQPIVPGDVLLGRFVVEEEEARGGCCVVHLARDVQQARPVAVKSLLPASETNRFGDLVRNRFGFECAISQKVRHAAFPRFIAEGCKTTEPFMVLEWLEGTTLAALLAMDGFNGMSGTQADASIDALCDAVGYLHKHGMTHADLKPGNLLFETSGKLRIIDLGSVVSQPYKENAPPAPALLTPAFSSPEQLEGQMALPRDDVFALACLVCILLDGRHPFAFRNALEARNGAMQPILPRYLPIHQHDALTQALSFVADERPKTAAAFLKLYRNAERRGA